MASHRRTGKPGHAAMGYRTHRLGYEVGQVGMNAISKVFKIYEGLRDLKQKWASTKVDERNLAPLGYPSIPISWIHSHPKGIEVPFFVADHCELGAAVWRNPQDSFESIKEEVDRRIDMVCHMDSWLREHPPEVQRRLDWPPFEIDQSHPLVEGTSTAYESVMGESAQYMTWQPVSDARFYQECGIPTLLIGPGDYRKTHCYDEYLELDQVPDAIKIYALAIVKWCGIE